MAIRDTTTLRLNEKNQSVFTKIIEDEGEKLESIGSGPGAEVG